MHLKLRRHLSWRLLRQLYKLKRHYSPLELIDKHLTEAGLSAQDIDTVHPFVKAPWAPAPEILLPPPIHGTSDAWACHLPQHTLYTDASVRHGLVGLAAVLPAHLQRPSITKAITVDRGTSPNVTSAELEAIEMALRLAAPFASVTAPDGVVRVASDSRKALQAIRRPNRLLALRRVY